MSYASPTNNFDFESLFLEEEQVPNFYQSPTESLLSTSSSGTDHTNSSNEQQQQQITYDVISDGYVFGNDFDLGQKPTQKGIKGENDLAAANPFFSQTNTTATTNQFSPLNPLNNFLYQNQKQPSFMGYQNPQLMSMYFPQTFPNCFPQFGNQPFPFPNNNILYTSPNTSPVGLTTSPNSNTSNNNLVTPQPNNNTTTNNTTTESKTKASRRKSAKKNTKSSTTTITNTTSAVPSSTINVTKPETSCTPQIEEEEKPITTTPKTSTPETTDSDNSNQSSEKEGENDSSSSSSEKKSDEKKRKRKSKKDGKDSKALSPEQEKELKRQRRLIKNRESAQASRERKKIYIQGLEKKVDGLAQEYNDLQGHCLTLEEENELLRQRLKMLGELVEEPTPKKRKMVPMSSNGQMKVPIPMDSRSFVNPFMLDFWSLFGMQQNVQQLQQTAQPTPDLAQLNPRAASSSRRVVMFIMLFCVAMFLVFPHSSDIKFDSQTTTTPSADQTESVTNRMSPASRKLASTDQKDTMVDVSIDASQQPFVDEEFKKNVAEIYSSFQQVRESSTTESQEKTEESSNPINDLTSRINVVFDTDKISLSFPKSILVKKEEDDEMVDEEKFSNSTTDEKVSQLSTKLLKEICRVVGQ